ncbi:cystein proteinase inhibitor protein salarin-like [Conger conger]|uniref:cystein proteinase inhibitor protein salarin-like n=1 Tax=Conger conger TaxID=82655 RepID=UPI002A5ADA41|nr:cystein proteinase inhibitor protein salarin-like [Conger conger]
MRQLGTVCLLLNSGRNTRLYTMSGDEEEDVATSGEEEEDVELYDNNSGNIDQEFEIWKKKYGKTYATPEEEARRKQAWLETRVRVTEHNRNYLAGKETWTMGANMFADRKVTIVAAVVVLAGLMG